MKPLESDEIDQIEGELGVRLPPVYRELLEQMGYGEFEPDPGAVFASTREIYHPSNIRGLYESFFDDPGDLFRRYFPLGCNNQTQEVWIVHVSTGRVASISHETVPDDWEREEWMRPEDWVRENIDF